MNRNKLVLATTLALAATSQANAGGLWLNQFGDFAAGRASAGASAGVDEATTIIHNPASSMQTEGSQLLVSAGVILADMQFDIDETNPISGNDDGGDAGLDAPLAGFSYVHDTGSDKWSTGIYMAGLSGAGLEYNDDWVGRFQATEVEILVLALSPTVAYQLTDDLSVGAGIQYFYGTLDLKLAIPSIRPGVDNGKGKLDGTDSGFGFTLGAVYEFSELTRLGINYQSEVELDFDGKLQVPANSVRVDSNTELSLAQMVRVSLHHSLDDQIGFDFTVGWDDWSALDEVFVALPSQGASLKKNWEDTYHYAAGFQYKASDRWDITAGIAYDTNPVSSSDRTADLPVDRQIRYNIGARYALRDNLKLGGYANYTDLGSAKIKANGWSGEYSSNNVIELGVYANWTL
ncbi:MAG: outer membrane protein transport protein [Halieaceae bacterium]